MDLYTELKKANDYIFKLELEINNLKIEAVERNRRYNELYDDFQTLAKSVMEAQIEKSNIGQQTA